MNEFDLIERIRARVPSAESVPVGIGDDAAVIRPSPGHELVVTTDSLVLGRHFTADWAADEVGHLALAVNLSDLAAMAARPAWALLSLTLPQADAHWLDGFLDGFLGLAERYQVVLVGGNVSSGPLNIGVQLIGETAPGAAVLRRGARAGDLLAVTGCLGDAAAALRLGPDAAASLRLRLRRPEPRVAAGQALAGRVSAMIDISDGLLADLAHLLAPGQGACVELARLPTSTALAAALPDPRARWPLQAGGGNDYELLLSLPPTELETARELLAELDLPLHPIGRINQDGGLVCLDELGQSLELKDGGWDHFVAR